MIDEALTIRGRGRMRFIGLTSCNGRIFHELADAAGSDVFPGAIFRGLIRPVDVAMRALSAKTDVFSDFF